MRRTYAVGDIHGSLTKLRSLITRCERDAAGAPMRFVFVGDYIDVGPDSRGVIDYLIALQGRLPGEVFTLMGDHEAIALAVLEGSADASPWAKADGAATLRSYSVAA